MDEVKRSHPAKLSREEIEHILSFSTNPILEVQFQQMKLLEEIFSILVNMKIDKGCTCGKVR